MNKEEAISTLSLLQCELTAEDKEYGYDSERSQLWEALELAIEALRGD